MSQPSFFFYDLETSGFSPTDARIMQFAGQRTDLQLNPVGDPVNVLLRMTDDVLPDVDAVLITGITPQATFENGMTEVAFLRYFEDEIALPGTIFTGYNSVRFDDEFMRTIHYRTFYDPYEWQWQDSRSKWDLLDVVRMTRALRPEHIKWPVDTKGNPTNRLELLTALNKLDHQHAHDALSDVAATIAVARLIRNKQEKLFDYLLSMRDKRKIADLVSGGKPFVYTSGRYPSEVQKTTVAIALCNHPGRSGSVFVYDLRHDPTTYKDMSAKQLADLWRWKKDAEQLRLPVKALQYNHCPAVAPLGVLDAASRERLQIDMAVINKHATLLAGIPDFDKRICEAWELLEAGRTQTTLVSTEQDVDGSMYGGFFNDEDKQLMRVVRAAQPTELSGLGLSFKDSRLNMLLPLYKARNYPASLNDEERAQWEAFRLQKLLGGEQHSRMARFYARLQEVAGRSDLTQHQQYLLEDLRLYAESIMPITDNE